MATLFGNGATYDSIEGRMRTHRKDAEKLRQEAEEHGTVINSGGRGRRTNWTTPKTPRSGRGAMSKSTSKKSGSGSAFVKSIFEGTPTKGKKALSGAGTSVNDAISLDDDDDMADIDIIDMLKDEEEVFSKPVFDKPKSETKSHPTPLSNIRKERKLSPNQRNTPALPQSPPRGGLFSARKETASVDSQSNGYAPSAPHVNSTHAPVPYRPPHVQDVADDANSSEYEYEYEDMA
jgi:hypothetical protein